MSKRWPQLKDCGMLLDSPPGSQIDAMCELLVEAQAAGAEVGGFVFNGVVVRRQFGETAEELKAEYFRKVRR